MKDKVYEVHVEINDDGTVKQEECTCSRAQVRCHHMAAILIHAHHNISVTDKHCSWKRKKSSSEDAYVPVEELFSNPKSESYRATKGPITQENKDKFYQSIKENFGLHVGFSWLLSPEVASSSSSIHNLESTLTSNELKSSSQKVQFLVDSVKVTVEQIQSIERRTVGQASNPLWLIAKRFLLTSSNFGAVLKACDSGRFPPSLFKRLLGTYDLQGVKAVQWGVDHEGEAKKLFEDAFGVQVQPCGLFIHESGLLGATPDGVLDDDNLAEIKCPYKMRDLDIEEALKKTENNYVLKLNGESIEINKQHEYYHQIQGQLFFAKRKCCHLVVWSTKGFINIPVMREEAWSLNIRKLISFYCQQLLQHILEESNT